DRPVRPAQGGLQVGMMVEVHRPRIELPLTQRQELRMLVVKIRHMGIELQLSFFDVQIGVALSTTGICRLGHPGLSLMLKVARTAGGSKRLLRVVNGSV